MWLSSSELLRFCFVKGLTLLQKNQLIKNLPATTKSLFDPMNWEGMQLASSVSKEMQKEEYKELTDKEWDLCHKNEIRIIGRFDKEYPILLKECEDAPLCLFVKGNYTFNQQELLSVVGSRKTTRYGEDFIQELMMDLSGLPLTIVSGLAIGSDIAAHRAAMENHIPTLAVMAHGLSVINPPRHRKEGLALQENGALLSEYLFDTPAFPSQFLERNRIIAGISRATVVVESDYRGGSLTTARCANSYNREVFALPGKTTDKYSRGCNRLISSQQAQLLTSAVDLHFSLGIEAAPKKKEPPSKKSVTPQQMQLFESLNKEEKQVLASMKGGGRIHLDELSLKVRMAPLQLTPLLLMLELKGVIKTLSGAFYEWNE